MTYPLEVCGVANTDWACLHAIRALERKYIPLVHTLFAEPIYEAFVMCRPAGTAVDL